MFGRNENKETKETLDWYKERLEWQEQYARDFNTRLNNFDQGLQRLAIEVSEIADTLNRKTEESQMSAHLEEILGRDNGSDKGATAPAEPIFKPVTLEDEETVDDSSELLATLGKASEGVVLHKLDKPKGKRKYTKRDTEFWKEGTTSSWPTKKQREEACWTLYRMLRQKNMYGSELRKCVNIKNIDGMLKRLEDIGVIQWDPVRHNDVYRKLYSAKGNYVKKDIFIDLLGYWKK